MSTVKCEACDELRENASSFVQNGVTNSICNSLKNDTGFNPNNSRNNCEDIEDANDCLIGRMAGEVEAYDVCDWKDYIKKFVENLYELIKAINCSMCGVWRKIHKHDCQIDVLFNGANFAFDRESQSSTAYIVPAKGVSYDDRQGQLDTGLYIQYVGGALARTAGALTFHAVDWQTDIKDIEGNRGKGNLVWKEQDTNTVNGNELVYEMRIKKSEYNIKRVVAGLGQTTNQGMALFTVGVFNGGEYAHGQHGLCNEDGTPYEEGMSAGHLVPDGWVYIQVRCSYIGNLIGASSDTQGITPRCWLGITMDTDNMC